MNYFRSAIEQPDDVPSWDGWWASHEDLVEKSFSRLEYLQLKYGNLEAARAILKTGDGQKAEQKHLPPQRPAPEVQAVIDLLLYEIDDSATRVAMIEAFNSAEALQRYCCAYVWGDAWGDGFQVPIAIANHPQCDLAIALDLFWLADGPSWLLKEIPVEDYNRDWASFCEMISERILRGKYQKGAASFKCQLGTAERYRYRKRALPEVFLTDVFGELPPIC